MFKVLENIKGASHRSVKVITLCSVLSLAFAQSGYAMPGGGEDTGGDDKVAVITLDPQKPEEVYNAKTKKPEGTITRAQGTEAYSILGPYVSAMATTKGQKKLRSAAGEQPVFDYLTTPMARIDGSEGQTCPVWRAINAAYVLRWYLISTSNRREELEGLLTAAQARIDELGRANAELAEAGVAEKARAEAAEAKVNTMSSSLEKATEQIAEFRKRLPATLASSMDDAERGGERDPLLSTNSMDLPEWHWYYWGMPWTWFFTKYK